MGTSGVDATGHQIVALPDGGSNVIFDGPAFSAPCAPVCLLALRRAETLARSLESGA